MNWTGKKVLITGADGFIGSHLVEELVKKKAKVRAFVYYNSFNSWGWLECLPKSTLNKIEVVSGDIRDSHGVAKAVVNVDIIFHLAALIGIPFSYHSPDSYVDTNIKGTLNILQAARAMNVDKVFHTSTSEVYGTAQYAPIDERHPISPQSPYAATKSAADDLALSFYKSFGLPVTIIRPFNTFGPRQSARAIIPTIISQIYAGEENIKLGSLDTIRDFNYVQDTVDAFVSMGGKKGTDGEIYNVGSGQEISIKELVDLIQMITKKKVSFTTDKERIRPAKSEVGRLICDATKIQKACGWSPQRNIEEGLILTCQWIKQNIKSYKSGIYNI